MKIDCGSSFYSFANSFRKDVFEQTQPPQLWSLEIFCLVLLVHTWYLLSFSLIWEGVEFTVPNVMEPCSVTDCKLTAK